MHKRRLRRPSPALVISVIALFVALGGTSYAAISLPKNSVGTKQLKNNAVSTKKIKNGAVTAAKINTKGLVVGSANVADASLTLTDLGGPGSAEQTRSVSTAITLAPGCMSMSLGLFNPPVGPTGASVIGGMVIGTLTDANGNAAVDNQVAVAPAMLIETSQGGAIVNLIVCNASSNPETIPAGSVFHWRVIYP